MEFLSATGEDGLDHASSSSRDFSSRDLQGLRYHDPPALQSDNPLLLSDHSGID